MLLEVLQKIRQERAFVVEPGSQVLDSTHQRLYLLPMKPSVFDPYVADRNVGIDRQERSTTLRIVRAAIRKAEGK